MANSNTPFGLRPLRRIDGAAPNYQLNAYKVLESDTTKIGTGDLVKLSSGYVARAAATDTPVLGVFAGCEWYDTTIQRKIFSPQWTGTTSAIAPVTAYVIDDVNTVFEIKSSGTVITVADIGKTAKIATATDPSASGISTEKLDQTSLATNQLTYPLKVVGLGKGQENDNTASYNTVEVVLNATVLKAGVA